MTPSKSLALRRAAQRGNQEAQIKFAIAYSYGEVRLPKRLRLVVVPWLIKAASQQRDPGAQCEVGHAYARGDGVKQDHEEAVRWYRRAANQGDADATYSLAKAFALGRGCPPDPVLATRLYRTASDAGEPRAQAELGIRLRWGLGCDPDPSSAIRYLLEAGRFGQTQAQLELADCYTVGIGVPKDHESALKWARRAAEAGDVRAYQTAGWLCAWSEAPRDLEEAERWLVLAVEAKRDGAAASLRALRLERFLGIRVQWVIPAITTVGWMALLAHTLLGNARFEPLAILAAVLVVPVVAVVVIGTVGKLLDHIQLDPQPSKAGMVRAVRDMRAALWRVPAEDGFFALPLLYLGLSPLTAAAAALLFGLAHYPGSPLAACLLKGALYFGVFMFLLPYGIWTVVAFHLSWDLLVIAGLKAAARAASQPATQ